MKNHSEPEKPEWFQLLDSDAPSAQVSKVNKKLPAFAVVIAGILFAGGAIFANASDSESAVASTQSSNSTAVTPDSTSPATSNDEAVPSSPAVQNPSQGGVQAPGVGRGHDGDRDGDFEGDHEGRERGHHDGDREEHEDRDDHEDREDF
jgi:hypothetical protein